MSQGARPSGAGGAAAVAGRNSRPPEAEFDGAEDPRRFKPVIKTIEKQNRYGGPTQRVIRMEKFGEVYQPIGGEVIYFDSKNIAVERIPLKYD